MKKGVYKQLNLTHLEAALPHVLEEARHEQWTERGSFWSEP